MTKHTTPSQPSKTVPTMLRLPADLHAWLTQQAEKELRSLNSQIIVLLQQARERSEADGPPYGD